MILFTTILPLLFSLFLSDPEQLKLQQDLQKDVLKLQKSNSYFISDNTSETASLQSILSDLQLFGMVSNLDLSKATVNQVQQGPHQIKQWTFDQGDIKRITQIESSIHLDTVITQRYLENRPPSQHRIVNDFTFRTYHIATTSDPEKLFYLTEADQGLLAYKLGEKKVGISYTSAKRGINDLLPKYKEEVQEILDKLNSPTK